MRKRVLNRVRAGPLVLHRIGFQNADEVFFGQLYGLYAGSVAKFQLHRPHLRALPPRAGVP